MKWYIEWWTPANFIGLGIRFGRNWKGERWGHLDLIFVEIGFQQYNLNP
jgi:hypothetical protein